MYLTSDLRFPVSGPSVGKNAKLFVLQKFWILEYLTREGPCVPACACT